MTQADYSLVEAYQQRDKALQREGEAVIKDMMPSQLQHMFACHLHTAGSGACQEKLFYITDRGGLSNVRLWKSGQITTPESGAEYDRKATVTKASVRMFTKQVAERLRNIGTRHMHDSTSMSVWLGDA